MPKLKHARTQWIRLSFSTSKRTALGGVLLEAVLLIEWFTEVNCGSAISNRLRRCFSLVRTLITRNCAAVRTRKCEKVATYKGL